MGNETERKIITIDEDKCIGCGLCINACQEGALELIDGIATLVRDDYCDGLGNCLPVCPTDAISFETRKAAPFDEKSVKENISPQQPAFSGCPGTKAQAINRKPQSKVTPKVPTSSQESQLMQWPIQIKLVPVNAPYFDNANLLIAADCTAFAYANFHEDFIKNHISIIGCPKLDEGDYAEKLTEIIKQNNIKKITIARMEVPCCSGLESAVKTALQNSGKMIPWQVAVISTNGDLLEI